MPRVYLDNDVFDTSAETLGGMIDAVRNAAGKRGRVVVEVRLDGETVPGGELDKRSEETVTAEEVQLITAEPFELARQTLLEVKEALAATRDDQQRAAELLQQDQAAAALEHVRQALGVWQQAGQSVLKSAQLLDLHLDQMQAGGRPIMKIVEELDQHLRQVREQLVAGDWLGLADTLSYELTETAQTWMAMIDVVCEHIRRRKSDSRPSS